MPRGSDFKIKLTASIANLGKVPKGEIGLGGLTLLCGPNNTGKTYVSKVLYSVLRAANADHGWNLVGHDVETIAHSLPAGPVGKTAVLRRKITELAGMPPHLLKEGRYAERVRALAGRQGFCAEALHPGFAKRFRNGRRITDRVAEANFAEMERSIKAIKRFARMPAEKVLQKSLASSLPALLLGSFMAPGLSALAAGGKSGFSFDIKGVLRFATADSKCRLAVKDVAKISAMPSVIYLDGMEAKISSGLIRAFGRLRSQHGIAEDFPCYHNDFLDMLDRPPSASGLSRDIGAQIAETIGGKLEYADGVLHFKEKKRRRINAALASAGVRRLGILGLLAERGLLRENATIFIDEPEADLYPAWQVEFSKILTSLALDGINIVLVTNSPYIIQHLKYRARNSEAFDKMFAVNHCSCGKGINGELKDYDNNYDRMKQVQAMLSETYVRTMYRGFAGD
ncbi:MAG: ATP-binding protein [Betaproteobacteria bacterium AqS2]|uniref:ATP-binding protein n=1 Tax=Candidatus Amphirhobacter heronislandensis TaxID=1732024 RepID=A0A930UGC2_9GAMM|nr:ATP-binding protein [Betaproteobacteria bacterium AqS2]